MESNRVTHDSVEPYKPLREILKSDETLMEEFNASTSGSELTTTSGRIILNTLLEVRGMIMGFLDGVNGAEEPDMPATNENIEKGLVKDPEKTWRV